MPDIPAPRSADYAAEKSREDCHAARNCGALKRWSRMQSTRVRKARLSAARVPASDVAQVDAADFGAGARRQRLDRKGVRGWSWALSGCELCHSEAFVQRNIIICHGLEGEAKSTSL